MSGSKSELGTSSPSKPEGEEQRSDGASPKSLVRAPSQASQQGASNKQLVPLPVKETNPFKIPPETEIFQLRDAERQRKKMDREKQRTLKVHEKTTYAHEMRARTLKARQPFADTQLEADEMTGSGDQLIGQDDPLQLATRDRHVEKEDLASFVAKKREMFLVQYSLGVKRDEMRKLEEIAQAEEKKLETAEQFLEEDAQMFDEFLKENDKNSVEAIKMAEQETKAKLEKVGEIKKIQAQITALKSEISKNEDQLKEYQTYKFFLDDLTPKEWQESRTQRRAARKAEHKKKKAEEKPLVAINMSKRASITKQDSKSHRSSLKNIRKTSGANVEDTQSLVSGISRDSDDDYESDDSCELYFTDPQQLLNIFAELEEQNLSLIQNSQETEEALDEMKQTIETTKSRMNKEAEVLKAQIASLDSQISAEEEKAKELEHKSKMFSYGQYKGDDQEKMLEVLNEKVEEVYRSCIGDNEANISTLQMLTNIENRLEELFEHIEMMPTEKVELAEKAKEKERRLKLREEKLEQQRLHQEERVRKALERAKADPKVQTGKRLVFRSRPPEVQKKKTDIVDKNNEEDEELAYYFS